MALRPDTPETRMVPVAGRQFAERRLMRGVGAKERAVGHAWGRLTSRARERFGNQRNFADAMQAEAERRAEKMQQDHAQQAIEKGRQMAREEAGISMAAEPGTMKEKLERARGSVSVAGAGQDRPDGLAKFGDDKPPAAKPARKSGFDVLHRAMAEGRIRDALSPAFSNFSNKEHEQAFARGYDNADWQGYVDENASDEDKEQARLEMKQARLLTKQYQYESLARARMRGQLGNRNPNRIY